MDRRPPRWFHRHPLRARFVVAATAILLCLGLVELAAQVLWPSTTSYRMKIWRYHDRLGWAHIPLQHTRLEHEDYSVDVQINSHGLRDDEYAWARGPKRRL